MIFTPILLGIFSDFFHWLSDLFTNFVHTWNNMLQGAISLVSFIYSGLSIISTSISWLPTLFTTLILLASSALVIKFVLAR